MAAKQGLHGHKGCVSAGCAVQLVCVPELCTAMQKCKLLAERMDRIETVLQQLRAWQRRWFSAAVRSCCSTI